MLLLTTDVDKHFGPGHNVHFTRTLLPFTSRRQEVLPVFPFGKRQLSLQTGHCGTELEQSQNRINAEIALLLLPKYNLVKHTTFYIAL